MLSKALIQLSAEGWGCTPFFIVVWPEALGSVGSMMELMVNSKRVYPDELWNEVCDIVQESLAVYSPQGCKEPDRTEVTCCC